MGAIAAASAHHLRQRPTPNTNPKGPAPIILHLSAGTTPYQAASRLIGDAERRNKDTVLCREVVLSAIREAKQARRQAWEDLQRRADYSNLIASVPIQVGHLHCTHSEGWPDTIQSDRVLKETKNAVGV